MNYGHLREEVVGSFQDLISPESAPVRVCGYTKHTLLKLCLASVTVMIVIGVLLPLTLLRRHPKKAGPGLIYEPDLGVVDGIYYDVTLSATTPNAMTERLSSISRSYVNTLDPQGPHIWNCTSEHHPDALDDSFCVYRPEWLGEECSEERHFGYGKNKPCIFIMFNKLLIGIRTIFSEPMQRIEIILFTGLGPCYIALKIVLVTVVIEVATSSSSKS
ncbi:hypothetical protein SK128_015428 [Halocaridina rubra]|uniref:Uncharacterized protein n=1 Tax=Halocaridina rubra TaxID=373956 RepID=A0AAN8ZVU8_HALRR